MKNKMKKVLNLTIAAALTLAVVACAGDQQKKEVFIPYPNWSEGIAMTHLAKVFLDKQEGYDVEIKPIEPGPIYASLSKGDADVFLDAWLPYTHAEYWERFGDKIDHIGTAFAGGTTGLVVPSYVTIDSITQLNDYVDKFDGEIIGIGSGAGIHKNTLKAIEEYDLNFKQVTSSGTAMVAALEKAINNNDWVVVTGWKPHFMWARYDIKYLEDPMGVYPTDELRILARKGFTEEFPKLAKFFSNFKLEEDKLYELMDAVENANDPLDGAEQFYQNNKAMVDGWWPAEE
ncbi:MAG: opuAC 1 [Anaerophaga sp.]|uniref:glycine betaine ABC transporter substrate-binding protein n=1 Tax=Anaerophaga thermohalophila TaxID=177400 RepID=UPI00111287CC|nr:glycine betaine ABC transporter substrate-binding protein [Anaerophaga thermohalophila]MBZ4675481.1 opuAC 1 [Anaerophaga sp.]MDK2841386.1 glycine betaine/proline transport system substrate-binding protein [Anaerophaga sp.]MDN5291453.1 glycine betaine/proline transport system substrate-binding protein [Anaerophaga sp.]